MILGICGGLAERTGIDTTLVRLGVALSVFLTGPLVILAYFIASMIIPSRPALAGTSWASLPPRHF